MRGLCATRTGLRAHRGGSLRARRGDYSSTTSVSPSFTAWPSLQRISTTVPASSASTGISIFIDSKIATVSPSAISSPTEHSIFQTVPVMCASTSTMPAGQYLSRPTVCRLVMTTAAFIIVTARNEAECLGDTLAALAGAFPGSPICVADDGSEDNTAALARSAGAIVVHSQRRGKGAAATLAARQVLAQLKPPGEAIAVLCDADLGSSAKLLDGLLEPLRRDEAELAVAAFARRQGGGLGVAVGFARWAIRRRCELTLSAPISGQRALRVRTLCDVLPFAHGYGMELGMTIDATRAGHRVCEVPLDLRHRATHRTPAGFAHRGRQLGDLARVYIGRMGGAQG
jgi:hypothetical protein